MDQSIKTISGKAVYVTGNDIDTDRIIPARFMKCVTFEGLGQHVFHDVRYEENGTSKNHPLDQPKYKGANILISDQNFGCGSSREHAPQALQKFGFKAMIAGSFAEIFFGNCTTLGIPCAVLHDADRKKLAEAIAAAAAPELTIDLVNKKITCGNLQFTFEMPESARSVLTNGKYDSLFELLSAADQIKMIDSRLKSA